MDVLGGASGSMVQSLGKTLTNTVKWSLAETGGEIDQPILRDDVVNLASNISTLGSLNKAYLIWKYGILVSKTGTLLASGLPTQAGFAQALGFAPGDGLSASAMQSWMKDQSAQVDDLSKQIVSFRQKAFAEGDRYDDYYKQINLLMRMYPDNIRQKALYKAHRGTPDAMYDSIANRYESQKALEQLSKTGDE